MCSSLRDLTAVLLSLGEGYVRTVTVDEEESTIIIYDNWRQVSQTTPHPQMNLVLSLD